MRTTDFFHLPTGTTTGARAAGGTEVRMRGRRIQRARAYVHATPTKPADHTPRHDQHDVRKWVATVRIPMRHGTAPDGGKPAATGHPDRRTRHVRDHRRDRHVRRAGHRLCVGGVHGRGRPTTRGTGSPHAKRQEYRHWALANGLDFEPFVMLTNGALHPASRRWLRRILGNQDQPTHHHECVRYDSGGHPGGHAAWKRARLQRSVRTRGAGVISPRVGEYPGDPSGS
ncbi:hypothetical protein TCDM_12024 [Trypanosoma cruzi Dm28c]|uniref:Uncharacterized protein n=1 Tax=Trypanosoma cruzi Dm28c TaxID=1416333 RepID=V5B7U4_TRYCR|nr:hypothetical protein TCDM_12024 [Trypanosoma cruzi Dm28c]